MTTETTADVFEAVSAKLGTTLPAEGVQEDPGEQQEVETPVVSDVPEEEAPSERSPSPLDATLASLAERYGFTGTPAELVSALATHFESPAEEVPTVDSLRSQLADIKDEDVTGSVNKKLDMLVAAIEKLEKAQGSVSQDVATVRAVEIDRQRAAFEQSFNATVDGLGELTPIAGKPENRRMLFGEVAGKAREYFNAHKQAPTGEALKTIVRTAARGLFFDQLVEAKTKELGSKLDKRATQFQSKPAHDVGGTVDPLQAKLAALRRIQEETGNI